MGNSVEQYRAAIGLGGFQPAHSPTFTAPVIVLGSMCLTKTTLLIGILLLIAGDVESNPGPGSTNNYETRLRKQQGEQNGKDAASDSDNISASGTSPSNHDLLMEIRAMRKEMRDYMCEMTEWRTNTDERMDEFESNFDSVDKRMDNMEIHLRRNNLIFYDIAEGDDESREDRDLKVRSFVSDKLDIPAQNLAISQTLRIGKTKPRPLLVTFANLSDRFEILGAAKTKLKPRTVKEDLPPKIREARINLAPFYAKALNDKKKVKVVGDTLIVDGKTYVFDKVKQTTVEVKKNSKT